MVTRNIYELSIDFPAYSRTSLYYAIFRTQRPWFKRTCPILEVNALRNEAANSCVLSRLSVKRAKRTTSSLADPFTWIKPIAP